MAGFHEQQRLQPSRARWLVGFPPALITALGIAQRWIGHPLGAHPLSNREYASLSIILWMMYLWLSRVRLVTDIDTTAVSIRLRGLSRHHRIQLASIESVSTVRFNPAQDFGGYGIRSVPGGRAYVAQGRQGVRFDLKGGGFVVIGSAHPDELAEATVERSVGRRVRHS